MLPYLIALDDVIDLPQVVAATCFVADLQQHQAYFLLSQFSRSDSALPSSLKLTEKETEVGKGGDGRENTKREKTEWGKEEAEETGRGRVSACVSIPPLAEEVFSSLVKNLR